jgi:hypothetical protein
MEMAERNSVSTGEIKRLAERATFAAEIHIETGMGRQLRSLAAHLQSSSACRCVTASDFRVTQKLFYESPST